MKKVWRCELTALNRAERKIRIEESRRQRSTAKQIAAIQGDCDRQVKALERAAERGFDAANHEIIRVQIRRAILAGRLSSGKTAPVSNPAA